MSTEVEAKEPDEIDPQQLEELRSSREFRDKISKLNERKQRLEQQRDKEQATLNETKNAIKKVDKQMQELINDASSPQMVMDFEKVQEEREERQEAERVEAIADDSVDSGVESGTIAMEGFGDWRERPVGQLSELHDKMADGWIKDLKRCGVLTLGQVEDAIDGNNDQLPEGLDSMKGWGPMKKMITGEAIQIAIDKYEGDASQGSSAEYEDVEDDSSDGAEPPKDGGKVSVRVKSITPNSLGIEQGDVVTGTLNGKMVVVDGGDGTEMTLMAKEFEIVTEESATA